MEMKEFHFWEGNPPAVLLKVRSSHPAHGGGGKDEIQTHPWFSSGEACAHVTMAALVNTEFDPNTPKYFITPTILHPLLVSASNYLEQAHRRSRV